MTTTYLTQIAIWPPIHGYFNTYLGPFWILTDINIQNLTLTNTYYNIHTAYVNPMCTYPKYSLTVLDIFLDILQFAMDMWPNG